MAGSHASGGQVPDEADAVIGDGGSQHEDSSSRLERFGLGVSASILLGAVVGVAATWSLNAGATPLLVALGLGFLLSPVVGLVVLWSRG
jgi:small-conductance mechanosensitive channel